MPRRALGLTSLVAVTATLLAGALPAAALSFEVLEWQGNATAEAAASAPGWSDADAESDSSNEPSALVQVTGPLLTAVGSAGADVFGTVLDLPVSGGVGAAGFTEVGRNQPEGFALADAEALTRIVFRASEDALIRIAGTVLGYRVALGGGGGHSLALIELASLDLANDPLLVSWSAEAGEREDFESPAALIAGERYQLLVLARAEADVLGHGLGWVGSEIRWRMAVIPEPATGIALALGLVGLALRRR